MRENTSKDNFDTNYLMECLSVSKFLAGLPEDALYELAYNSELRSFSADEPIFTSNQFDGQELFLMHRGRARLTMMSPENGNIIIEDMGAGSLIGLEYIVGGVDCTLLHSELVASEDSEILIIDSAVLADMIKRRPVVARAFLTLFARELLQLRVDSCTEDDPNKKVYRILRDMAREQKVLSETEWRIAQLPKHKDLAERAIVEEVEVAEAIAYLISEGVAVREYPGLVIKDMVRFKSLCF